MHDLFPTRAEFRAGLRRAAQRRRADEARLFGPHRPAVGIPPSSVAPDLAEELDAVGQQLRAEEAVSPYGRPQTDEAKRVMNALLRG